VNSKQLFSGPCTVVQNRVVTGVYNGWFEYDADLREFKFTSAGQILFKFPASYVTGMVSSTYGTLRKKQAAKVGVKYPDGNECIYRFDSSDMATFDRIELVVNQVKGEDVGGREVIRLLRTHDRVPISEVCTVLTKYHLPNGFEDGKRRIETCISLGIVKGSIQGKEFVSGASMEKEVVHYNIVANFDFSDSGVLKIKCPSCGAGVPLEKKEAVGKCSYCGATYTVPKKILDFL